MGVDDSAYYQIFKHLNAKIIKLAVAEVNKAPNIELTVELRKQGRAVTDIRFIVGDNQQTAMFDLDDVPGIRKTGTYEALIAQGVADPARYLNAAIRDDYRASGATPPPSPQATAAVEVQRAADRLADAQATAREAEISAERRVRAARMSRVREIVAGRNPTQTGACFCQRWTMT